MSPPSSSGLPPVTSARNYLDNFKNLLGPGTSELTDMTKNFSLPFSYQKYSHVTPADINKLVMTSERIQTMLAKACVLSLQKKTELVNNVKQILDEIGLDKSMPIIRILGTILNFGQILSGLHVNEIKLNQPTVTAAALFRTITATIDKMKYLNQKEAISVDEELFNEYKFSVDQLMELAGLSCAHAINDCYGFAQSPIKRKVLVCCGPGNNGGDGLVAARHLSLMNYEAHVYYPKRTEKELFINLQHQCESMGIAVSKDCPSLEWVDREFGLIVDALFGFSFKPPVRESFVPIMDVLKQSKLPIVSVDIPSGWHVEDGPQDENSIKPNCLISLTAPKLCARKLSNAKHYLGGRFVPPKLQEKCEMQLPSYENNNLFVKLS